MKLLCLNVWGGREHAPLMDYRDGDHRLPQRAALYSEIAAALPDHAGMFCPAARGDLWVGEQAVPSFWGLATFVRNTIPVISQRQGFVHKTYGADGYGDHPRSRNAHAIRLYDHQANRAVTVLQTHGLRDPAGKHDTPERQKQADRLAKMARAVAEPGDALIICGDLNVEPQSETLRILGDLGLTELVTTGGFSGTRSALYPKPGRFADYMLINDRVKVTRFDVISTPVVSDHCPLLLDF
ncbi:endonuclease/exonuclease/phosphatase family protein [Halovulum sp. GXIMD14793]